MKKGMLIGAIVLVMAGLIACTLPPGSGAPSVDGIVVFPDAGLDGVVRQAISKPEGPIHIADAQRVIKLDTRGIGRNILTLAGSNSAPS